MSASSSTPLPLAGRVAFITGGARGIGRAIALKLAGAGCDVAVVYHTSQEEAEAVCGDCARWAGGRSRCRRT